MRRLTDVFVIAAGCGGREEVIGQGSPKMIMCTGRKAMRRGCAAAACVLLTGLVGVSASQDRTGSLSGVITDTTGRGLPGATITAVAEQGEARLAVTNSAGAYRLDGLHGRYRVEARMNGFVAKMVETVIGSAQDGIWGGALLVGGVFDGVSVERQVSLAIGLQAVDCGRHSSPVSETALQRSLECGLASVRAGRPFSVLVQFAERDPRTGRGLLAGPDGFVQMLEYDTAGATFSLKPCPLPAVTTSRNRPRAGFEFTCRASIPANF
jgi:hypothetical protein